MANSLNLFRIDLPGDRFKMAVLGCRSLVLVRNYNSNTKIEIFGYFMNCQEILKCLSMASEIDVIYLKGNSGMIAINFESQ